MTQLDHEPMPKCPRCADFAGEATLESIKEARAAVYRAKTLVARNNYCSGWMISALDEATKQLKFAEMLMLEALQCDDDVPF